MIRDLATALAGLCTFYWWVHLLASARRIVQRRFVVAPGTHALPADGEAPAVSVLIPARDEEAVIERCLRSVLAQDHPLREVLVLDDGSTDRTAELVDAIAAEHGIVRRLDGAELPPGWKGKNHALWQAAAEASGEWLLFVDADVELGEQAVRQAVGEARAHGADMLSWFAQLELEGFWERALMPFIADFIVLFSPLHKVNDPVRDECIANGQFILIRRSVYDQVGGHAAIRDSIIDDVSLARAVKLGGWRFRMVFALGLMQTRMYTTFREIWNGWAKNFYPAMQRSPGLALGAVIYLLLSGVAPAVLLPFGLAGLASGTAGWFELLAVAGAAGVLAYRALIHRVDPGYPLAYALLHPLQALVLSGIVIDSAARDAGLRGGSWKGRTYGGTGTRTG